MHGYYQTCYANEGSHQWLPGLVLVAISLTSARHAMPEQAGLRARVATRSLLETRSLGAGEIFQLPCWKTCAFGPLYLTPDSATSVHELKWGGRPGGTALEMRDKQLDWLQAFFIMYWAVYSPTKNLLPVEVLPKKGVPQLLAVS